MMLFLMINWFYVWRKDFIIYTIFRLVSWTRLTSTQFYDAISYVSGVCCKELGKAIADTRRAGYVDKSMEIIAETIDLIGNSFYMAVV